MTYNIISGLLAVIFLISGLSKISGSNAGLSGTQMLELKIHLPD
jgi:hypothetical protein